MIVTFPCPAVGRIARRAGASRQTFHRHNLSLLPPTKFPGPSTVRAFSKGGSSYRAQAPGPKMKSWESGARLVKNISVENQYLEHIREVHDPSQHLKTIEDELRGTIGKALGKQGQKILSAVRLMDQEFQKYQELLEQDAPSSKLVACAKQHNIHRKQAMQARWELTVHRQAVGFVVGNHKFVQEKFPIGEQLPEEMDPSSEETEEEVVPKKQFSDQLEWWQKIGRWR